MDAKALCGMGWQKSTFLAKRPLYYKGLFYVKRTVYYKGLSYVPRMYCKPIHYKGLSYVSYIFHLEHRPGKSAAMQIDALSRHMCQQCGTSHIPFQEHHSERPCSDGSEQCRELGTSIRPGRTEGGTTDQVDPVLGKAIEWLEKGDRPEAKDVATASTEPKSFGAQWARLELSQGVLY